jgi:eukaryotic-like serine/threonine-protein kinase
VANASSVLRSEEHPWLPADHAPFAGKYTVERILGQGGMGTVFEARHIRLEQRVAIKVLGSALREYPELVQRFEREARACGSLSSAHAVRIFDIDATDDGTPFIVMEFLAGRDLAQVVERDGPQAVSRSVRWLVEACDAIAEAHRLGIIHRDLKPSNLFLSEVEGRLVVKVLDFGIAKRVTSTDSSITQALCPLGTPQYMSPEQVRCAKDVDVRTDVWSLGVTLYELVTGRTPYPEESASACIAAIAADPVPDPRGIRPDLDDAFVEVLMRALAKQAKDRYQSIEELVSALAPFANADEDQEMVSTVARAIRSMPEGPALTPIAYGTSYRVRTFEPRAPLGSSSDRTVPPAVSIAMPVPKRRWRSSIAIASASALGLVVLLLGARLSATAPASESASQLPVAAHLAAQVGTAALDVPAIVTAPSVPVAALEESPAPTIVAAPAPIAVPPEVRVASVVSKPLVARPLVPALAGPTTDDAKHAVPAAGRAKIDKPISQATASRSVHGGLSNPGF